MWMYEDNIVEVPFDEGRLFERLVNIKIGDKHL